MPKLIDYPRTTYTGAWELAEVVDDTGGKCAIETAARKLNRKVSGSFKAIIGSAVKFGLMTSKRELLSTTTLFKRIKHAYDKQEEILFHREAFLTPPLFTQICRKFRGRELPIQMLDVMLIREFSVEEINAQGVAKAFVEGCRMCGLLDDHNMMADIDAMTTQRLPRRELASPAPSVNNLPQRATPTHTQPISLASPNHLYELLADITSSTESSEAETNALPNNRETDTISSLFGLDKPSREQPETPNSPAQDEQQLPLPQQPNVSYETPSLAFLPQVQAKTEETSQTVRPITGYQLNITGPGVNTSIEVTHEEDIAIAIALLEKIRRQLRS